MGNKSAGKRQDRESAFLLKVIKIFGAALVVAIILSILKVQNLQIQRTGKIKVGEKILTIAYAEINNEVNQGLSGKKVFPKDRGLFYVFPVDGNYFFWMKDMNFPVDIIFLGSDYKIVDILYSAQPCSSGGCPKITPPEKFRYALEVSSGWSKENELKIGDQFEIQNQ